MRMAEIENYIDSLLARGRGAFSRDEALAALAIKPEALTAMITRQIAKRRLANPRQEFYVILRPEDRIAGAPEPARWIDPLMEHLKTDYRISLLRAAALHGASHQASMTFQVIAPKQFRPIIIGRHRLEFIYQAPKAFIAVNKPEWLSQLKTEAGFAKAAGVELTLLDCIRYYPKAMGIGGVAQITKDIGRQADPRKLRMAAVHYENTAVRRLGYLLELAGHLRLAEALKPFVLKANKAVPLNPSVKVIAESLSSDYERNETWQLDLNETVEYDS
jgi:hypothetical protein